MTRWPEYPDPDLLGELVDRDFVEEEAYEQAFEQHLQELERLAIRSYLAP